MSDLREELSRLAQGLEPDTHPQFDHLLGRARRRRRLRIAAVSSAVAATAAAIVVPLTIGRDAGGRERITPAESITPSKTQEPTRPPSNPNCPTDLLPPGRNAAIAARDAAAAAVPELYDKNERRGYSIVAVRPASAEPADQYEAVPFGMCGSIVGKRTWVVILRFPAGAPSNSLSGGQLFAGRFADGWHIWFRLH